MRNFTLTELSRGSGAIVDAAFAGPVLLTKHGKGRLVMLPAEEYEKLVGKSGDVRVARYTHETPLDELDALTKALDNAINAVQVDDAD